MSKTICKIIISLVAFLLLFAGPQKTTYASESATIGITPSSGSHTVGEEFDVSVVVNGGGQNFTSFGASVSVSNLTVVSLTRGGSVTNWTTLPSEGSLGFYGAVGGQTSSVTVYTLKVRGNSAGAASVNISGGEVKAVITDGDGNQVPTNIFAGQSGGDYQITAPAAPTPTTKPNSTTTKKPTTTTSQPAQPAATPSPATPPTTPVTVPIPTPPTLPNNENALEKQWAGFTSDMALKILISANNAELKYDSGNHTTSGLEFTGTAAPNSLVTLYIFSNPLVKSVMTDASGNWKIIVADPLNDGLHTAYAISTKNNTSAKSADKFTFQIDSTKQLVSQVIVRNSHSAQQTCQKREASLVKDIWFWISMVFLVFIGFLILLKLGIVEKIFKR